jgi:hypothetical protein
LERIRRYTLGGRRRPKQPLRPNRRLSPFPPGPSRQLLQEPAWLPALHDLVYELLETEEIADPVSKRLERAPDLLLSDAGELPEPTGAALEAAAAAG